jgi:hypothetical protein
VPENRGIFASQSIADRVVVLAKGTVAHDGPPDSLRADPELMGRYLGVEANTALTGPEPEPPSIGRHRLPARRTPLLFPRLAGRAAVAG